MNKTTLKNILAFNEEREKKAKDNFKVAVDKPDVHNSKTKSRKKEENEVPTGGKTVSGEQANKIITDPTLGESAGGSLVVMSFGRMNPPTIGHQKLVDAVVSVAKQTAGKPYVYLSRSEDKSSNPIPYKKKLAYAKLAFGDVIVDTPKSTPTIFDVARNLANHYSNMIVVVGSDRVDELQKKFDKYVGTEHLPFNTVKVVSAGERDPDSSSVSGMSASKMRAAALAGDKKAFVSGLPSKLRPAANKIMQDIVGKTRVVKEENIGEVVAIMESRIEEDYDFSEKEMKSIEQKANRSGFSSHILETVFRRGVHTWLNEDTELSHQQYAFNRINSFLAGGTAVIIDEDLIDLHIESMIDEKVENDDDDLSVLEPAKNAPANMTSISSNLVSRTRNPETSASKKVVGASDKTVDPSKLKPTKPLNLQTLMKLVYYEQKLNEVWNRDDPDSSGYHHGYHNKHLSHDDMVAKFPNKEHQDKWHAAHKRGSSDKATGKDPE